MVKFTRTSKAASHLAAFFNIMIQCEDYTGDLTVTSPSGEVIEKISFEKEISIGGLI